jgi:hypothetical protein
MCMFCGWKMWSNQSKHDFLKKELNLVKSKINETSVAVDEASKGQEDKFAREKRKNAELEESKNTKNKEIADLTRKRDGMKMIFDEKLTQVEQTAANIQNIKVGLAGIDKKILQQRVAVRELNLSIPTLNESLNKLGEQITEEMGRRGSLNKKILSYDEETDILKSHFEDTISALQKDFYQRPWLERGEKVSVSFSNVDLNAGILMLPIGKNYGLEEKMRFLVRARGQSICQIRIKAVSYDHSVAMIVPLVGNPNQLTEVNNFDLICQ